MEEQKAIEEKRAIQIPTTLKSLLEALIFSADEPLSVKDIRVLYGESASGLEQRDLDPIEIERTVAMLNEEYQSADRPYRIINIGGGYLFATRKEYAEWIGLLSWEQSRRKLSQSAVESLAIIAYKQPISKPEIEAIRGVNCDYVLKSLLEKDLVTITGRANTVGRPLLYGTTRQFLMHFGLNNVTDLPRPREIEEILGESQFETERRMLEAQQAAEKAKKEAEDFKSRLPHIPKRKPEMDETVQIVPKKRPRDIKLRPPENQTEMFVAPSHPKKPVEQQDVSVPGVAEVGEINNSFADILPPSSSSATAIDQTVPLPPFLPPTEVREVVESPFISFEPETSPAPPPTEQLEALEEQKETDIEPALSDSALGPVKRSAELDQLSQVEPLKHEEMEAARASIPADEQSLLHRPFAEESVIERSIEEPTVLEPQDAGEQRSTSRWQAWKQRVQTFIKKLFG
ncbi:MAG: SMC-Scp complex subunit ScpB [Ignavibacteria bacterium]|nr:SMC-Scp complex subunit ScpB [Ignavibacteria bacterium]